MRRLDNHTDPEHVWGIMEKAMGHVAFDVGANVGQAAKVLAENFVTVVCFEPHPDSYQVLAEEAPRCVHAYRWAASDETGWIKLSVTEQHNETGQYTTGEGLHWGKEIGCVQVQSITLDDAAETLQLYPSFIKIDTEGHEVHVLRGAQRLLAKELPEVLVEVHKKENEQPVRDLLLGYDITKLEHDSLRPESEIRQNHFWLHGVAHGTAR